MEAAFPARETSQRQRERRICFTLLLYSRRETIWYDSNSMW